MLAVFGYGTVAKGLIAILEKQNLRFKVFARNPQKLGRAHVAVAVSGGESAALELVEGVDVVFEAMCGASGLPWSVARHCIKCQKVLITSNKALIAEHYDELVALQSEYPKARVFIEACVCGGLPLIKTLQLSTLGSQDRVLRFEGILNGSTNYLLCRAQTEFEQGEVGDAPKSGEDIFQSIVADMMDKGVLEADPSLDLDGPDAASKLKILAALLLQWNCEAQLQVTGVSHLIASDLAFMRAHHFDAIRLVCRLRPNNSGCWEATIRPELVKHESPFASCRGFDNVVVLHTDYMPSLQIAGPGAGMMPTANAMYSDYVYTLTTDIEGRSKEPYTPGHLPSRSPEAPKVEQSPSARPVESMFYVFRKKRDSPAASDWGYRIASALDAREQAEVFVACFSGS